MSADLDQIAAPLQDVKDQLGNIAKENQAAVNGHGDAVTKTLEELKDLVNTGKSPIDESGKSSSQVEEDVQSMAREERNRVVTVQCPDALKKQLSAAEGEWKRINSKQSKVIQEQANEPEDLKKQLNELRNSQTSGSDQVNQTLEDVKTALSSNSENSGTEVWEHVNEMKTSWTRGIVLCAPPFCVDV